MCCIPHTGPRYLYLDCDFPGVLINVWTGLTFTFHLQSSWIPNLFFPVYVERIHRAKHGSDTGTYDIDGFFHGESFSKIFERHDKYVILYILPPSHGIYFFKKKLIQSNRGNKGGLTYFELIDMMKRNRNAGDVLGWSFQFFLWSGLWLLAADPRTGILSKEDILAHYDGYVDDLDKVFFWLGVNVPTNLLYEYTLQDIVLRN